MKVSRFGGKIVISTYFYTNKKGPAQATRSPKFTTGREGGIRTHGPLRNT